MLWITRCPDVALIRQGVTLCKAELILRDVQRRKPMLNVQGLILLRPLVRIAASAFMFCCIIVPSQVVSMHVFSHSGQQTCPPRLRLYLSIRTAPHIMCFGKCSPRAHTGRRRSTA